MNALYRFLKSIRLAVVLIHVITAASLLAPLVRLVSPDRFFSSAIFLVPVFLFTVNLGVCAADRLIARERNKAKRRHGPDLVLSGLCLTSFQKRGDAAA